MNAHGNVNQGEVIFSSQQIAMSFVFTFNEG
jgi:hypothetical protein